MSRVDHEHGAEPQSLATAYSPVHSQQSQSSESLFRVSHEQPGYDKTSPRETVWMYTFYVFVKPLEKSSELQRRRIHAPYSCGGLSSSGCVGAFDVRRLACSLGRSANHGEDCDRGARGASPVVSGCARARSGCERCQSGVSTPISFKERCSNSWRCSRFTG